MRQATALLCLLTTLMFGMFARTKTHNLRELGTVDLPSSLEPRGVVEHPHEAAFTFDHIYDSFFMMGSHTPISEKLVLVFSGPAADPTTVLNLAKNAADSTKVTAWRTDGPYLIGEGIHEVNASKHPAWVLIRKDDARHLTAGYMRWQKQASLADGKSTLDRVFASLRLTRPVPDYLRIAADRPGHITRHRLDQLRQLLANRSLKVDLNGPVQESAGIFYSLFTTETQGPRFDAIALLGDQPAGRYLILNPTPPRGIANLPNLCAFHFTDNAWTPDCPYTLPRRLADTLRRRLPDPTRVYFFATSASFPGEVDEFTTLDSHFSYGVENLWRAQPFLKERFDQGTLTQRRP